MRKILFVIVLCLCALCAVQAQDIPNGSKWWSGTDLYTATVRVGGVVYFQDSDDHELTIEKVGDKPGAYKIIPSRQINLLCVVNLDGAFSISVRKA